jgi:four helix bundle protein
MQEAKFGFKELKVWQKSMSFVGQVLGIAEEIHQSKRHFRLIEQLESAAASIPQNIAEGKGRNSKKEFIQFLYFARGSLYETVTLLCLFENQGLILKQTAQALELEAFEIAQMLKGLINAIRQSQEFRKKALMLEGGSLL